MNISCIVPAFNEASTISTVLRVLSAYPQISEIIVVDDGSTDGTADTVKREFPHIRVIGLTANRGKADALIAGVAKARSPILFFCDADLTGLTQSHIKQLIAPVAAGKTRMVCGAQEYMNSWKKTDGLKRPAHGAFNDFVLGLGGEKVLWKKDFLNIPHLAGTQYGIEQNIVRYYQKNHIPFSYHVLSGVGHRHKVAKWGLRKGMIKEVWALATFLLQLGNQMVTGNT